MPLTSEVLSGRNRETGDQPDSQCDIFWYGKLIGNALPCGVVVAKRQTSALQTPSTEGIIEFEDETLVIII